MSADAIASFIFIFWRKIQCHCSLTRITRRLYVWQSQYCQHERSGLERGAVFRTLHGWSKGYPYGSQERSHWCCGAFVPKASPAHFYHVHEDEFASSQSEAMLHVATISCGKCEGDAISFPRANGLPIVLQSHRMRPRHSDGGRESWGLLLPRLRQVVVAINQVGSEGRLLDGWTRSAHHKSSRLIWFERRFTDAGKNGTGKLIQPPYRAMWQLEHYARGSLRVVPTDHLEQSARVSKLGWCWAGNSYVVRFNCGSRVGPWSLDATVIAPK